MIALAAAAALSALPQISCHGTNLVTPDGNPIVLQGVNLGGWLVEEPWMTPWKSDPPVGSNAPKATNHVDLWGAVEAHLGHEAMVRVRNAWRDNWITDLDFKEIKAAGFNHVRIPFLDSLLVEPGGMGWLVQAVDKARQNGLYVVLDMHGAPGGQSKEDHTGEGGRNGLWFDPGNVARMEELWARLAAQFRNTNVCLFDLMNEPMGAPSTDAMNLVYNAVIRAVHAVNPTRIVLVEDGYKGFDTTPIPKERGWNNVCYSLHFYQFDAKQPSDHLKALEADIAADKPLQAARDTPMYIGEFNLEPFAGPEVTRSYIDILDATGWSWAIWTWKGDPVSGTLGQWGVLRPKGAAEPIDPFLDSEAAMIRKIKAARTENFEPIPGLLGALIH